MSSRIVVRGREVTNPVARAVIGITVAPLAVGFAAAVTLLALAFTGIVLAFAGIVITLSIGFVDLVLVAVGVLLPVVIVLAVLGKAFSVPFRILNRRGKS